MQGHQVFELRDYTMRPGRRDELVTLFEREFIESQEALGSRVVGTFRDLDAPDHFVWMRSFADMETRASALDGFYSSELWRTHRNAANATMIDTDNVLLLKPVGRDPVAPATRRPAIGETQGGGLIIATIYPLAHGAEDAFLAALDTSDAIACFRTEHAPNSYPRLPVREGESVVVTLRRSIASTPLPDGLIAAPQVMRLAPTARSLLR